MSYPSRQRGVSFGYGIDDPYTIVTLVVIGVVSVVTGVALYFYLSFSYISVARVALVLGPFIGVLVLVLAESLHLSGGSGKMGEIRRVTQGIPWGGSELVLDLICGRGPMSVSAAKRLTTGFVVGIDTWDARHVSGNNPYSLVANAEIDKVDGKVFPVLGVTTSLPFRTGAFDVVVSGFGLGHAGDMNARKRAIKEFTLALKEGGRVSILVAGRSQEYESYLSELGMTEVKIASSRIGIFPPVQRISARKPYSVATKP